MIGSLKKKTKIGKPQGAEFYISKKVGRAIMDYQMLVDKDKIAVAVSGGKDSLTLLKILRDRLSFVPIKYDLLALHIDLGYPVSIAKKLERYFQKHDYHYHIEKRNFLKEEKKKGINCFWCSWNRRKAIFETAHKLGYRKIALGHHKDDIASTLLLNLFFQGEISAMNPKQELFQGAITLIRPLAYVEEKEIIRFAKTQDFAHLEYKCPQANHSRRNKIMKIIQEIEKINPALKTNIFRAMTRIKSEYLL